MLPLWSPGLLIIFKIFCYLGMSECSIIILNTILFTYLHCFRKTFKKSCSEKIFHWCWLIHFSFYIKNIFHTKVSAVFSKWFQELQISIFLNSWTTATAFSLSTSLDLSEILSFNFFVSSLSFRNITVFLIVDPEFYQFIHNFLLILIGHIHSG